jgi:hypothetical protein
MIFRILHIVLRVGSMEVKAAIHHPQLHEPQLERLRGLCPTRSNSKKNTALLTPLPTIHQSLTIIEECFNIKIFAVIIFYILLSDKDQT